MASYKHLLVGRERERTTTNGLGRVLLLSELLSNPPAERAERSAPSPTDGCPQRVSILGVTDATPPVRAVRVTPCNV
jgi:hypothetical protein